VAEDRLLVRGALEHLNHGVAHAGLAQRIDRQRGGMVFLLDFIERALECQRAVSSS